MPSAFDIINTAAQYLGVPYKKGQASKTGVDCSGLIYLAMQSVGINTKRQTWLDWSSDVGQKVAGGIESARPGDALYFTNSNPTVPNPLNIGHVGIYIGNGMMIHAPRAGKTVEIVAVGNRNLVGVKRYAAAAPTSFTIPGTSYTVPGTAATGSANAAENDLSNLTGVDLAVDAAYKAGFRGQDLYKMIAIAGRESGGWNPRAFNGNTSTGDKSYGLTQINMLGSLGPARRAALGISSDDQLFDPYINMRAAFMLYSDAKSRGKDPFHAWGPYKGKDALYSTEQYQESARSATSRYQPGTGSANAAEYGAGFTPEQQAASAGSAIANAAMSLVTKATSGPAGGAFQGQAVGPFRAPAGGGGEVVKANGQTWVTYNIGSAKIGWLVSDPGSGYTSAIDVAGLPVRDMTPSEWHQFKMVDAGTADELGGMAGQSFDKFVDNLLMQVFGRNNPARNDPGVLEVIAEFAARPDMDPVELENRLKSTSYYQGLTVAQAEWNDLPEGERTKRRDELALRMSDTIFEMVGVTVDPNHPLVRLYLDDVASGKTAYGVFTSAVKQTALQNPESPWARQVRSEDEAQRQRPIDIENMALRVKDLARQWGVRMSPSSATQWAKDIVEVRKSEDDLLTNLKLQAGVLYPNKPPDMDTQSYAAPWVDTVQRLLEKPVDLFDQRVQSSLVNGEMPFQLEKAIKLGPEWLSTKNGQRDMAGALAGLGQLLGF